MLWNHGPSASARRLISSRLSVAIASIASLPDRGAVAMQRADVDIGVAGLDAQGLAAGGQVGVDEGADVLVPAQTLAPQPLELVQAAARHLERAPDPMRGGVLLLDL